MQGMAIFGQKGRKLRNPSGFVGTKSGERFLAFDHLAQVSVVFPIPHNLRHLRGGKADLSSRLGRMELLFHHAGCAQFAPDHFKHHARMRSRNESLSVVAFAHQGPFPKVNLPICLHKCKFIIFP